MPVLDGCINALFEPGNIGASVGTPPVIIYKTSLYPPGMYVLVAEAGSYALTGADADMTIGVPAISSEVAAFLARTSGLDATHTNAYTALIDGLVADGIWSKLDMLHIYATQNTTTAQLNLVSSSYPATLNGSPTFTTDRGYTGVDGSSTVYINTGFNAATATTPKFVQNSAHFSAWSVTNTSSGYPVMGTRGPSINSLIYPANGGVAYILINNAFGATAANANGSGHYIGSRTASNVIAGYRNGTSLYTGSETSGFVQSNDVYVLNHNYSGVAGGGSAYQVAMASIGSALNSTEATAFYNRLRTYMTTVGVP